jgi:uncharacterized protein DUF4124
MSVFQTFHRAPPLLLFAALASLATSADAAIYKCQEMDGRTSYQQAPCPGGGEEATIRPQPPSSAEESAARERSQRDKAAAQDLEREQEARRREAVRETESRNAALKEATARCAKYLDDAQALVQRSQTRKKPHERERDERKAENLRTRHFSECYVAGR